MEKNLKSNQKQPVDIQKIIINYARYLESSRGLSHRTIKDYCKDIEVFFQYQTKKGKILLDHLSSKKIIKSFLKYSQNHSASRIQHITSALRSFLRYLRQAHLVEEDLASVIPSVANRKKTPYPDTLSSNMIDKFLKSCDRKDPLGKRNYAILLLMTTLGLRSCEVCDLKLHDIDWGRGEITIRSKGTEERFPLFEEMGKALVDYLKNSRPNCKSKKIFIRSVNPLKGITTACIRHIVRSALYRCGLSPKKQGAHLIRHSFAMELFRKGTTLEQISVVLRHKDIETTAIYAQANFDRLKAIVQPWPQNVNMEGGHEEII